MIKIFKKFKLPKCSWKIFFKELKDEIVKDRVTTGAAALSFYLILSIFPALIFLLTLLPYLPIENLSEAVLNTINQTMPKEVSKLIQGVIQQLLSNQKGGLLSFGILFTLWTASNGFYIVMDQLNVTYDVSESRPFWKARGIAILLMIFFVLLVVMAFSLILLGGKFQDQLMAFFGWGEVISLSFTILRWSIILIFLLLAFATTYYFGPDVEQEFSFVTLGSLMGTAGLILFSLSFRFYIENFGNYSATYGSLGAVIILLLWLYLFGLVLLVGSEVNALVEHYDQDGKNQGEKKIER